MEDSITRSVSYCKNRRTYNL